MVNGEKNCIKIFFLNNFILNRAYTISLFTILKHSRTKFTLKYGLKIYQAKIPTKPFLNATVNCTYRNYFRTSNKYILTQNIIEIFTYLQFWQIYLAIRITQDDRLLSNLCIKLSNKENIEKKSVYLNWSDFKSYWNITKVRNKNKIFQ